MAKKKVIEQEVEEEPTQSSKFIAIVTGQGMKRRADGRIDTVDYREAFVLDSAEAPLSEVVSHYLKPRLLKKFGKDITGVYTHRLETVFPEDDPESIEGLSIDTMSMVQLAKYCKSRNLAGFDEKCFSDILEARETVRASLESPQLFLSTLTFYKERTKKKKYHASVLARSDEDDILAKYDARKEANPAPKQEEFTIA